MRNEDVYIENARLSREILSWFDEEIEKRRWSLTEKDKTVYRWLVRNRPVIVKEIQDNLKRAWK